MKLAECPPSTAPAPTVREAYLTAQEASQFLRHQYFLMTGIETSRWHPDTLRRMCQDGRLPVRNNRQKKGIREQWMIPVSALRKLVQGGGYV